MKATTTHTDVKSKIDELATKLDNEHERVTTSLSNVHKTQQDLVLFRSLNREPQLKYNAKCLVDNPDFAAYKLVIEMILSIPGIRLFSKYKYKAPTYRITDQEELQRRIKQQFRSEWYQFKKYVRTQEVPYNESRGGVFAYPTTTLHTRKFNDIGKAKRELEAIIRKAQSIKTATLQLTDSELDSIASASALVNK